MSGQIIEHSLAWRRLFRMTSACLSGTRSLSQPQGPQGTPGCKRLGLFEADEPLALWEMWKPKAGIIGTENSSVSTQSVGVHQRPFQNRAPECAYGDLG